MLEEKEHTLGPGKRRGCHCGAQERLVCLEAKERGWHRPILGHSLPSLQEAGPRSRRHRCQGLKHFSKAGRMPTWGDCPTRARVETPPQEMPLLYEANDVTRVHTCAHTHTHVTRTPRHTTDTCHTRDMHTHPTPHPYSLLWRSRVLHMDGP